MKKVLALLATTLLLPIVATAKPISVGGSDIAQWGHYDLYTAKFIATAAVAASPI
ncbi:hypothetical protein GW937_02440 [Candidatus Kaiserbacteria bacterium]|nr:hypothetical protein [Candidatus Kaiserbacteria bacterium]